MCRGLLKRSHQLLPFLHSRGALFIAREVPRQIEIVIGPMNMKSWRSSIQMSIRPDAHRFQTLLNLRPCRGVIFDVAPPNFWVVLEVDGLSILFHRHDSVLKDQHAAIDWISLSRDERCFIRT